MEKMTEKKIHRRNYAKIAAAGVVGIAIGAAGGYFAAPRGVTEKTVTETITQAVTKTVTGEAPTPTPTKWSLSEAAKPFKGSRVDMSWPSGEHQESAAEDKKGEWESATGIPLTITTMSPDALHDKILPEFRVGSASFNCEGVASYWLTEVVAPGYFDPLDEYFESSKYADIVDPEFELEDLLPEHLNFVGMYNIEEQRMGGGPGSRMYLMPGAQADGHWIVYRTDLLEQYGFDPPETWDQFQEIVETCNDPENEVFGTATAGRFEATMILTEWSNRFISQGGDIFSGTKIDRDVKPNINTPLGLKALEQIIDTKPYSPPGSASYGLAEKVDTMAAGKAAIITTWCSVSGRIFTPELSEVADKTFAEIMPGIGENRGRCTRGGWAMGIPKFAKDKEVAFLAIQWYSTKEMDKYRHVEYGLCPVRTSTYKDPELIKIRPTLPVLEQAVKKAEILEMAEFLECWEIVDIMARNFSAAYVDEQTPEEAVENADNEVYDTLKRAGVTT